MVRLICFSSAGMGCSNFYKWSEYLKPEVIIDAIEYPGHGMLLGTDLPASMEALCNYCWEVVVKRVGEQEEIYLLGHSLGAMVAYELTKRFNKQMDSRLKKVILCGCPAPNFFVDYLNGLTDMNQESFVSYVHSLGGVPKEMLDNPIFLEIYLPIIKHDFQMIGEYIPFLEKVRTPLVIINGSKDLIVKNKYQHWSWYTDNQEVTSHIIEGDHFFIDKVIEITALINQVLF